MKTKNILLAAALAAFVAAPSIANAASDTSSADAVIIAPVSVTKASDLQFGTLGTTGTAGAVLISEAGVRTNPDTNVSLLAGTTATQASFTVAGANNAAVTVTVPTTATLTGSVSGTMIATLSSTESGVGTLDGSGAKTVDVAASLAVGATQAAGTYATTFDVTVIYN